MASGSLLEIISYWPSSKEANSALQAQRGWFRGRDVPEDSTYLTMSQVASKMIGEVEEHTVEALQRRYLGSVVVPESRLIPEYVVVARA